MSAYFGARLSYTRAQEANKILIASGACFLSLLTITGLYFLGSKTDFSIAQNEVAQNISAPQRVSVLIPISDIAQSVALEPSMFRIENLSLSEVPKTSIRDFEQIKNTYARTLIVADRPLDTAYLSNVRPISKIDPLIPKDFRAVSIKVDKITSVEAWAVPEAHVDINLITTSSGETTLVPIAFNAKIISVERKTASNVNSENSEANPSSLTLIATPSDANRIQLAQATGQLSLTLRGTDSDGKIGEMSTIKIGDIVKPSRNDKKSQRPKNTVKIDGETFAIGEDGTLTSMGL